MDANGNKTVYTPVANVSRTRVTISVSANNLAYQYTADFDANSYAPVWAGAHQGL